MSEKETTKKTAGLLTKIFLWVVGIMFTFAFGCFVLLLVLFSSTDEERQQYDQEKLQRQKALATLSESVQTFHSTHKAYPPPEVIRTIKDDALQESLASRAIRYYRKSDSTGRVCYVIEVITDVRTNWSGRRYSNKPECIDLPQDAKPNNNGTYSNILDLH